MGPTRPVVRKAFAIVCSLRRVALPNCFAQRGINFLERSSSMSNIEHVVILVLENRSFDEWHV